MTKMTKTDEVLEAIFNWGYGFGGLLFSIFVGAPIMGLLVVAFISTLVYIFSFMGLI